MKGVEDDVNGFVDVNFDTVDTVDTAENVETVEIIDDSCTPRSDETLLRQSHQEKLA